MSEFSATRFTLARRRRAAKVKDLAAAAGITRQTLSAYERGAKAPSEETLEKIASVLNFPVGFFFGPDLDDVQPEHASFRSLSTMTAGQRDAVTAAAALAFAINAALERRYNMPLPSVPDLHDHEPEQAAAILRAQWQLGERPIGNVVHTLEAHGVRVFSLPEDADEVHAFATWCGSSPFVFLNTWKSAEGSRFDASHELGHLVLHRHEKPQGRQAETEANAFASAFLMPRNSVLASAPRYASLREMFPVKKTWGVSLAAVVRRLRDLKVLSEWDYHDACVQLSSRGWRKAEPDPLAHREQSQVLRKVIELMREDGLSLSAFAAELDLPSADVNKLLFHLVPRPADDAEAPRSVLPQTSRASNGLRLVVSKP